MDELPVSGPVYVQATCARLSGIPSFGSSKFLRNPNGNKAREMGFNRARSIWSAGHLTSDCAKRQISCKQVCFINFSDEVGPVSAIAAFFLPGENEWPTT